MMNPRRCIYLAQSICCLRTVLPGLWTGARQSQVLDDADLMELIRVVKGSWPLPRGAFARDYTSMDVGRLVASTAMSLGFLAMKDVGLSDEAFQTLKQRQASKTTKMWDTLGLHTAEAFDAFHRAVVQVQSYPYGVDDQDDKCN